VSDFLSAELGSLKAVDLGMLALILVSLLVGVWRGLVFEVMSLLGWVLAWWGALQWGPDAGALLGLGAPGSVVRSAVGFVLCFALILVVCSLLARLAKTLISATPLGLLDRLLGALFGLGRGVLILLLLVTLVAWTPLAQTEAWRGAQVVVVVMALQHGFQSWFPARLGFLSAPAL
jgi:membrane protein required for colicin V production